MGRSSSEIVLSVLVPVQSSPVNTRPSEFMKFSHCPIRVLAIFDQKFFFYYDGILIEFCLLIPNIRPKVLNSVVEGVRRAFEVSLLYIQVGPLYDSCNPKAAKSKLKIVLWVPTVILSLYDKRIRCVPSCSRKRQEKKLIWSIWLTP